jgi:hypothetical protein
MSQILPVHKGTAAHRPKTGLPPAWLAPRFSAGLSGFWRRLASSTGSRRNWIKRSGSYAGGDSARLADSDIQPGLPFLFNRLVDA